MEWFKAKAEFFKKGAIIPQRVLKGPRKKKHLIRFTSDSWVLPTKLGYLVAVDCGDHGAVVCAIGVKNAHFIGSPYGGFTRYVGNAGVSDQQWSENVRRQYLLTK